jgi:hypothetical protein
MLFSAMVEESSFFLRARCLNSATKHNPRLRALLALLIYITGEPGLCFSRSRACMSDVSAVPLPPALKTLGATLDIIRLAGNKPTRALLARVKASGTRHEDTTAWLIEKGVEVCPASLGERVTYQDAYAQGLGVSEAEPSGKAALEIKNVYLYVSSLLDLPTRRENNEEGRSARQRVA